MNMIQKRKKDAKSNIYIPKNTEEIEKVLKAYHEASGYGSVGDMVFMIKKRYCWDNMIKDIKNFVENCITCKIFAGANMNTKNRSFRTSRPNELWECD